jgi:hypothetical protein
VQSLGPGAVAVDKCQADWAGPACLDCASDLRQLIAYRQGANTFASRGEKSIDEGRSDRRNARFTYPAEEHVVVVRHDVHMGFPWRCVKCQFFPAVSNYEKLYH